MKGLFWRADYYGAIVVGGSAALYAGRLDALLKLGHQCVFASSGRLKLAKEVTTYFIPHNRFFSNYPEVLNLPYNLKSTNAILRIIDKEKPDFLFQHQHDYMFSGALAKRKSGIPFVLHCDGVEYWIKTNWSKAFMPKLLKEYELIQWDNADIILVPSEEIGNQIKENSVDPQKIIFAQNGVDTDVFNPNINGDKVRKKFNLEDKFVIGYSGSFSQWHGVEVIAQSIKQVKDAIPNVMFFFIGDGILRGPVDDYIKANHLEDYSIITGYIPWEEVPEHLSACDVLASPCINNQNFTFFNSPLKIFESLSMGKPLITTNVGQLKYIIKDKVNGLICKDEEPEDLALKIIDLYKDPDLARQISIRAREDAVTYYDWRYYINRLLDNIKIIK